MTEFPGILLASASPRRRELLEQIGVQYETALHGVDESARPEESAADYVQRLAFEKALWVETALTPSLPVLGADTVVVCDGRILGKPVDHDDALRILSLLSGRTHQVMSAIALCRRGRQEVCVVTTEVEFRELTTAEMEAYWASGEPADKAGAYGIQGLGGMFVRRLSGSYSAVVGLPIYETAAMLMSFGVRTGLSHDEQRALISKEP